MGHGNLRRYLVIAGWTALLSAVAFIFGLPFAYAVWAWR